MRIATAKIGDLLSLAQICIDLPGAKIISSFLAKVRSITIACRRLSNKSITPNYIIKDYITYKYYRKTRNETDICKKLSNAFLSLIFSMDSLADKYDIDQHVVLFLARTLFTENDVNDNDGIDNIANIN